MVLLYCMCVLFVMLLVLFIWGGIYTCRRRNDELSFSSKVYQGPAGEPFWTGTLPSHVDDYEKPRYVYENLKESYDYLPENGRIIGYRISPELVIHSRINPALNMTELDSYIARYGGALLNLEDIELLLDNWYEISLLRKKSGDTSLDNIKRFWAVSDLNLPIIINIVDQRVEGVIDILSSEALILKR